jgi:hypothetical protein
MLQTVTNEAEVDFRTELYKYSVALLSIETSQFPTESSTHTAILQSNGNCYPTTLLI